MATPTTNGPFKCPDCDATFEKAQSLGPHRNKAHGWRKSDNRSDPKRIAKGNPRLSHPRGEPFNPNPKGSKRPHMKSQNLVCPERGCGFVAAWVGGLKNHMRSHKPKPERNVTTLVKTDKDAHHPSQNGHAPNPQDDGNHRIEAAATFAAGRIAQLLENIAIQHEVPFRAFTALVLRTVAATAQIR